MPLCPPLGMCRIRDSVSLMRCPSRSVPASGVGAEKRRYDLFASCPATVLSQSTYASASRAEELIFIRGPNALSRRSSDVAWGGLYGRRSMDSKLLSQSGGSLACSLRHICAAGHRVSKCIRSGLEWMRRASTRLRESRTRKWARAHDRSMRTAQ